MEWKDIKTAPKDGRPVWVKGYDFGNPKRGEHRCWAWWDGRYWVEAGTGKEIGLLAYLVEWLPPQKQEE